VEHQPTIILCFGMQLYLGKSNCFESSRIFVFSKFFFDFKNKRPHDTPFEDGTFKLTLNFTEDYPNKPPIVRFVSKMFHPNGKQFIFVLYSCLLS